MLKAYQVDGSELREAEGDLDAATLKKMQWVDLCDASREEKDLIESATLPLALYLFVRICGL